MNPDRQPDRGPDPLEQFVQRALRDLPARRAPRTLEERVLVEIARRAALPWWRQNFAHWPAPALAAFLLVSLGVIQVIVSGTAWVMAGFDPSQLQGVVAQPVAWWDSLRTVGEAVTSTLQITFRNLPPVWLYGGLATMAAVYAALFGLGAAAFKALRAHH